MSQVSLRPDAVVLPTLLHLRARQDFSFNWITKMRSQSVNAVLSFARLARRSERNKSCGYYSRQATRETIHSYYCYIADLQKTNDRDNSLPR